MAANRGDPSQIVHDKLAKYPVGVRVAARKIPTIKRAVRRIKRGNTPLEPDSLRSIPELPTEYITTGGADNIPFLMYDNFQEGEDNSNRLIVFATFSGLKCLCDSDFWFMDGTFGTAPKQFQQLFIIRVLEEKCPITCVYALLPSKDQSTYEETFTAILNTCNEHNLVPSPVSITCDFEVAIHNAIHTMFGAGVRIQGCFYHLTQSTWRRVQQEGLSVRYKEEDEIKQFCGMLDGLAFLPPERVSEGMNLLKQQVPEGLFDLVDYFDTTYVHGPLKAIPGARGLIRMQQTNSPRFAIDKWNVNAVTLEDGHRTNNVCESWNTAFNKLVGHKNPGLWHVISCIQKDQLAMITELERIRIGDPTKK